MIPLLYCYCSASWYCGGELVLGVFKKWAESDTQQIIDLGLWMIAYTQSGTAGRPRILSRTPAYPGLYSCACVIACAVSGCVCTLLFGLHFYHLLILARTTSSLHLHCITLHEQRKRYLLAVFLALRVARYIVSIVEVP